jgi:hypothetical protein
MSEISARWEQPWHRMGSASRSPPTPGVWYAPTSSTEPPKDHRRLSPTALHELLKSAAASTSIQLVGTDPLGAPAHAGAAWMAHRGLRATRLQDPYPWEPPWPPKSDHVTRDDLAHGFGWPIDRLEMALQALERRLARTGIRLRRVEWTGYTLGPNLGALTPQERSRIDHDRHKALDGARNEEYVRSKHGLTALPRW